MPGLKPQFKAQTRELALGLSESFFPTFSSVQNQLPVANKPVLNCGTTALTSMSSGAPLKQKHKILHLCRCCILVCVFRSKSELAVIFL